ncbi:MAG: DUF2971 domain-containing protein [Clostridia bacterium]|nr:DUF2971 domain-containing protein [Clostridia bacterium]
MKNARIYINKRGKMILYKYRANTEFTEKIFLDQKVWLSNASGLNDPFECSMQEISKEWTDKQVEEGMQAQIAGLVMGAMNHLANNQGFWGMKPYQVKAMLKTLGRKKSLEEKYKMCREFIKSKTGHYPSDLKATISEFDKQLNEVGIFSLSETCENQLMWSHYAEDAKGIAIGFSVEKNTKLTDANHCVKVNYSDILPEFTGDGFISELSIYIDEFGRPYSKNKISFSDPTFKLAVSTKPTCWSYENEWRYVEEKSGSYNLPAPIKEIVFGLRCPPENREKYRSLAEKYISNPINFYEIQKVPNTNSIVKKEIK